MPLEVRLRQPWTTVENSYAAGSLAAPALDSRIALEKPPGLVRLREVSRGIRLPLEASLPERIGGAIEVVTRLLWLRGSRRDLSVQHVARAERVARVACELE
jgi:hypothetical protein